jgi:acyl-CoA thioesterase-2
MLKIEELKELLTLEKIEENIFKGENYKAPWKRVFGGQALAQSLMAAYETIDDERYAHSLHAYFILPGDIEVPIIYNVDRLRDGGSFTTRRVVAIQKGRPIFNMAASFQVERRGLEHQINMPNVPGPEYLPTDEELLEPLKKKAPHIYQNLYHPRPIEFRPVEKYDPLNPTNRSPFQHVWFKTNGKLPEQKQLHQVVLAYASDYNLLTTAILPHREEVQGTKMFFASLDHAMWFHRDFRVDDWLLYQLDSPSASNTRGFTRGNVFDRDGNLVASVVQEGLMTVRR